MIGMLHKMDGIGMVYIVIRLSNFVKMYIFKRNTYIFFFTQFDAIAKQYL